VSRVRLVIVKVCEPQARSVWITNELGKDVEDSSTDLVQRTVIELRGTKRAKERTCRKTRYFTSERRNKRLTKK
jgi:hypothetical protein